MKKFLAISFCMLLCGTFIFTGCRSESANQSAPPTETPTAPPTEPPKEPTEECDILLSVFWPPMEGFTTEKQFDYLAEADIDLLEYGTDPIFTAPETIEAVLRLATEKGLKITVADRDFVNWDKKQTMKFANWFIVIRIMNALPATLSKMSLETPIH